MKRVRKMSRRKNWEDEKADKGENKKEKGI